MKLKTRQELWAQLKYLTKLERVSFRKIRCDKYLGKLTEAGIFSSFTPLKSISLQIGMLTTPTAVALVNSLKQCPLVELDLSNNYLCGFIIELYQMPGVIFTRLEKIKCTDCDLRNKDTMTLARLISERRLPAIKAIIIERNYLSIDKVASEELQKSCERLQKWNGYRVQVYIDRRNKIRKRETYV